MWQGLISIYVKQGWGKYAALREAVLQVEPPALFPIEHHINLRLASRLFMILQRFESSVRSKSLWFHEEP